MQLALESINNQVAHDNDFKIKNESDNEIDEKYEENEDEDDVLIDEDEQLDRDIDEGGGGTDMSIVLQTCTIV